MTTAAILNRTKEFLIKDRLAEATNLILYFSWAWTLFADSRVLELHSYRGFAAPAWQYGLLFVALTAGTVVGMLSYRWCRKVASEAMMCGAVAWLLIGVEYWYSYPPFQPWMVAIPGWAIINLLVSLEMERECKCRGDDV